MANTAKTIDELTDRYGARYALTCGISKYFPQMKGTSKVFWVEGNLGDDDDPGCGQTPDAPLKTISAALALCTKDTNDYIFPMNTYAPEGQTYPIVIDKSFIHIIGGWGDKSPTWIHADAEGATVPAIQFTTGGANCELAYLELGAGADAAGIEVAVNSLWANHIHHCRFGMCLGMGAEYGIELVAAAEMMNWIIEHCRFGELLDEGGIYVPATAGPNGVRGTIIRNNIIRVADSKIGINIADVSGDFEDGGIFDNRFDVDTGPGAAITFAEGAKGMIDGNHVMVKDDSDPLAVTDSSILVGTDTDGLASLGVNYYSGTLCTAEGDYTED